MKINVDLIKSMFIGILVGVIILQFGRICIVQGISMQPTLDDKNIVLLNKMAYKNKIPNRGDIIAFKHTSPFEESNEKFLIKRVIAVGGEHILIENGNVYVNGELLNENYTEGNTFGDIDMTVPTGKVFVMGDNRKNSFDSRDKRIGAVHEDYILGKIIYKK